MRGAGRVAVRRPTSAKVALLVVCAGLGAAAGFFRYEAKLERMTPWQRAREISFENNTGSTKFAAVVDASICGGLAFCAGATAITTALKFAQKGGRK